MVEFEIIKFSDSYDLASNVWQVVIERTETEDLFDVTFDLCTPTKIKQLFSQSNRWTLLHEFINSDPS